MVERALRRPRETGFTLIELLLAMTLSMIAMVGIISLSTNAARYQITTASKGRSTSGALYSLARMQRELQDASVLFQPALGAQGSVVSGCNNWSQANNGPDKRLNTAANVTSFYYCIAGTQLLRYQNIGASCVALGPSCGGGAFETVVGVSPGFYAMDNLGYFFDRRGDSSIEVHYIVGQATPTYAVPIPQAYKVNVLLNVNKAYTNTND